MGCLVYITVTWPDITFVVHKLSQFSAHPRTTHLVVAHKVLHYIKSTAGQDILFYSNSTISLNNFYDLDWGACSKIWRSIIHYAYSSMTYPSHGRLRNSSWCLDFYSKSNIPPSPALSRTHMALTTSSKPEYISYTTHHGLLQWSNNHPYQQQPNISWKDYTYWNRLLLRKR